jgi:hypothetical protein
VRRRVRGEGEKEKMYDLCPKELRTWSPKFPTKIKLVSPQNFEKPRITMKWKVQEWKG